MITIRPAVRADAQALFDWRNDAGTRAASISREPVTWEEHSAWFTGSLANGRRRIYLGSLDDEGQAGQVVGMCRFDIADDSGSAEVSINLNPASRGRGLAGMVLSNSIVGFLRENETIGRLTATIRHSNPASIRLFTNAGFALVSADEQFGYFVRG